MKTNLRNRIIAGVLVAVLSAGTVIATVAILRLDQALLWVGCFILSERIKIYLARSYD